MLRMLFAVSTAAVIASGAMAAEPIYVTTSARLEPYGLADSLTFVTSYFTDVSTALAVSITKASSSNSTSSTQSQSKQIAPTIKHAEWRPITDNSGQPIAGQITLTVSCDLSGILTANANYMTIQNSSIPGYNGHFPITGLIATPISSSLIGTKVTLKTKTTDDPGSYDGKGSITDTFCPDEKSAGGDTAYSIVFNTATVPKDRGYLYLYRNAFFSDSVNVSVDNSGMLSSSDSSSQQQITAILTELAQTGALFLHPTGGPSLREEIAPQVKDDPRKACYDAIAQLLKSGPYYKVARVTPKQIAQPTFVWPVPIPASSNPKVTIFLRLDHSPLLSDFEGFDRTEVDDNGRRRIISFHSGLVAFLPVPARASIICKADGMSEVYLAAPTTMSLYVQRQFIDPQRDFLTNPTDTLTFNAGIITAHKYTDQSSAKTVVDTITAPVRALFPSVTVQQTTSVQSQAGKPEQVTTTTQTTAAPPKGP